MLTLFPPPICCTRLHSSSFFFTMLKDLLWKIYAFYASEAPLLTSMEPVHPSTPTKKLKCTPDFRVAAKFNKKLLEQDSLWQLFRDFEFVPFVIK